MKAQDDEPDVDPFLCGCGACRQFWQRTFHQVAGGMACPAPLRARNSSSLGATSSHLLKLGDRVLVRGQYQGTVKYVGFLDENEINPPLYVGVKLDDNIGSVHNGVHEGKRYFHCARGHGLIVPYHEAVSLRPPLRRPPLTGNRMFPSFPQVQRRRRERQEKLQELYQSNVPKQPGSTKTPRPPKIPPRPSRAFLLRLGSAPQRKHVRNEDDLELKEGKARERQRKYPAGLLRRQSDPDVFSPGEDRQLRRLRGELGGGQDAERMLGTLQRLQLAYNEGFELVHGRHSLYPGHSNYP